MLPHVGQDADAQLVGSTEFSPSPASLLPKRVVPAREDMEVGAEAPSRSKVDSSKSKSDSGPILKLCREWVGGLPTPKPTLMDF